VGVLKLFAVFIAALGMALVESDRSEAVTDDDGLFVGSAHPLPARPLVGRRRR
jgi:hypothetical protein